MSYPMTYQRVIHRNGLADGDYEKPPGVWQCRVNTREIDDINASVSKVRRKRLLEYENSVSILAGDLRRLEQDTRDERATCAYIAHRTGVDKEEVAAVLKEFLDW